MSATEAETGKPGAPHSASTNANTCAACA
jgi:hypothetical protein